MTTTTKQILIAFGIIALLVIAMPIVFLLGVSLFGKGNSPEFTAKQAEGRDFGKNTDQQGCMQQGLLRAKDIRLFKIEQLGFNHAFVEECLKSSRPTPGFCDGVPSSFVSDATEWREKQCRKSGMDELLTGCKAVFDDKVGFCNE